MNIAILGVALKKPGTQKCLLIFYLHFIGLQTTMSGGFVINFRLNRFFAGTFVAQKISPLLFLDKK
jgi:hypothetical protein